MSFATPAISCNDRVILVKVLDNLPISSLRSVTATSTLRSPPAIFSATPEISLSGPEILRVIEKPASERKMKAEKVPQTMVECV